MSYIYAKALLCAEDPSFKVNLLDYLGKYESLRISCASSISIGAAYLPANVFWCILYRCADSNPVVRKSCGEALQNIDRTAIRWSEEQIAAIARRCLERTQDEDSEVQHSFIQLLGSISCADGIALRDETFTSLHSSVMLSSVEKAFPELLLGSTRLATFSVQRVKRSTE